MGTLTLSSEAEIWDLQDRLSDETTSRMEFDLNTLTVTWADPAYDSAISIAVAAAAAGAPLPSVDPTTLARKLDEATAAVGAIADSMAALAGQVSLLDASGGTLLTEIAGLDGRVDSLSAAMAAESVAVRSSLDGLAGQVAGATSSIAAILSDQQSYSRAFSGVSSGYKKWSAIPGVGKIVVTAQMAGQWVFSAFAGDEANGRGIGVQVILNGEVYAANSTDGSNKIDGSYSSVGAVMALSAGDTINFKIAHDISRAFIAGRIAGSKLF